MKEKRFTAETLVREMEIQIDPLGVIKYGSYSHTYLRLIDDKKQLLKMSFVDETLNTKCFLHCKAR